MRSLGSGGLSVRSLTTSNKAEISYDSGWLLPKGTGACSSTTTTDIDKNTDTHTDTETHRQTHRHRHTPKRGYCDVFPGFAVLKPKVWSAPRWLLRRGSCGLKCSSLEFEIAAEMVTPEIRCSSLVFALRSTANPRISVAIATSEAPKGASRGDLKWRLKWSPQKSVALASV